MDRILRESIVISWTVVIGPRSGRVTFRRRTMVGWFALIFSAGVAPDFSFHSLFWLMARAKAVSGSTDALLLKLGDCLPLGKSWYFPCPSCGIFLELGFSLSSRAARDGD